MADEQGQGLSAGQITGIGAGAAVGGFMQGQQTAVNSQIYGEGFKQLGSKTLGSTTSKAPINLNINRASFLENCSTSAIGRGLATLGFSTTKNRASREEMLKVTAEHRNFLIEAQEAHSNADLETLRGIYTAAVKSAVDNETLKAIKDFAEELKK